MSRYFLEITRYGDNKVIVVWLLSYTEKDNDDVLAFLNKTAEAGSVRAQYILGCLYDEDGGLNPGGGRAKGRVERDDLEAVKWYEKAAENGHVESQNILGIKYLAGTENKIEKDYAKALKWFQKAMDNGSETAPYNLGLMYYNGTGVKQYPGKAQEYFQKAAERGNTDAKSYLDELKSNN